MRLILLYLLAGKHYAIAIRDERHRLRPVARPRLPDRTTLALWVLLLLAGVALLTGAK